MSAEDASRLAQACYDQAIAGRRSTRAVARELLRTEDRQVIEFLAVEFLVAEVQRAQRATTLDAERASEVNTTAQSAEVTAEQVARWDKLRQEDERDYWLRQQSLMANIQRAIDRYTEDMKMKWTAELLDSTFALRDGTPVKWGDATVEQHEERRQMFKDNARANIEGAARHEAALHDLRESGAATLREMAGVAA